MGRNLNMPWSMEDTVENMERIRSMIIKKIRQVNLDGKAEEDVREVNFDFDRVKNALEKENPKLVDIYGDEDEVYAYCPGCQVDLWEMEECGYNCCPYCGQAIEWLKN